MAYGNRLFWQATKIELKALIRYMGIKLHMLITGVRVLCVCADQPNIQIISRILKRCVKIELGYYDEIHSN